MLFQLRVGDLSVEPIELLGMPCIRYVCNSMQMSWRGVAKYTTGNLAVAS